VRIPILPAVLVGLASFAARATETRVIGDDPPVELTRDVLYGADPLLQSLDVYRPLNAREALPVLIFLHGGGWSGGDKGRDPTRGVFFARAGIVYITANYRLSPAVRHPAHAEDVARAVAWVRQNIARYGGDRSSVYLMGHSAGAHLAALVATAPRYLKQYGVSPEIVRGAILLDGSGYDLVRRVPTSGGWLREMLLNAFGKDPSAWRDASPQHQLSRDRPPPPFLLFHVAGRQASEAQARSFARALRTAGGHADVVAVTDRTHNSIEDRIGTAGDPVGPRILELIRSRRADGGGVRLSPF
jgi:arylformamidase